MAGKRLIDPQNAKGGVGDHDTFGHVLEHGGRQLQFLLDLFARGDVAGGAGEAQRRAVLIALKQAAAIQHPAPIARFGADSIFQFEIFPAPGQMATDAAQHPFAIIRMNQIEHGGTGRRQFGRCVAEHFGNAHAGNDGGFQIPVPDTIAGTPEGRLQMRAGGLQLLPFQIAQPSTAPLPEQDSGQNAGHQQQTRSGNAQHGVSGVYRRCGKQRPDAAYRNRRDKRRAKTETLCGHLVWLVVGGPAGL